MLEKMARDVRGLVSLLSNVNARMDALRVIRHVRDRGRRIERRRLIDRNRTVLKTLRTNADPFMCTEEIFRGKYRLSQDLARMLIEELRPLMPHTERAHALSVDTKVLCTLHFYATGSYQKSTGSDANVNLSQASVSKAITQVTGALNTPQMLTRYLRFPHTPQERTAVIHKNFAAFHIPGVLGFVDGTHVAIRAPYQHEELYVNRKGFHSLNAQIVCDADLIILNMLPRYPGSSHDSFIWRGSAVRAKMQECYNNNEQCWLLGDSGYPLEPWLLVPFLQADPDSPQDRYNIMHRRARSVVERCIGVLKARFRCLLKHRVLEYDERKAGFFVNACSILHNICVKNHVPEPEEDYPYEEEVPVENAPLADNLVGRGRQILAAGERVRANVMRRVVAVP